MNKKIILIGIVSLLLFVTSVAAGNDVIVPKGGETWYKGSTYLVKWRAEVKGRIAVDLYAGQGKIKTLYSYIETGKSILPRQYNWTIPKKIKTRKDYKVKLVYLGKGSRILAESRDPFSILSKRKVAVIQDMEIRGMRPAILAVQSPNGEEKILKSDPYAIWWTVNRGIGRPTIIIKKGGIPVRTYALVTPIGPLAGNRYKWTWNIPAGLSLGDDYRVRIEGESGSPDDESNRDFSLVDKKIDVTMPRADAVWPRGSTQTIRFRCTNITQNLKVWVRGYPQVIIAENVRPTDFEVTWRNVGTARGVVVPSTRHVIRVETMDGSVIGDSHWVSIPD